ncbi:uncharacterized protein FA14DRAFT_155893 [Meira miltonrushii]|uniref:FAD-binding FR-type domain-containing protein n=1 Tax=Meira miltonrushii TaxID=1280837 RepID=A0A316VAH2_9BASI|nr:uncharacterized protein FA14DRAFT_155893 [Meira miltonrushii]PWN33193.1 hypothetical protein FA14DRAFT_155893 [Meira miltonrushii]
MTNGVRPWSTAGIEKKAAKGGYKKGTIEYDNFVQTNLAKAYNSFKVPTIAGYVILGGFGLLVLAVGLYRLICFLANRRRNGLPSKKTKLENVIQKSVTKKPFVGERHAQEYGKGLFTFRSPLRIHVIVLFFLFLANIIPLTAFYQILDPAKNTSWPNNRYAAQSRYFADRSSVLAVAQLPILFLLSGRNSPVVFVTGCSFNTLMLYHRWIGRLVAVLALLHGIAYTAYLVNLGKYTQYWWKYNWFPLGPVALIMFVFIIFTAHRPVIRKYAYDVFIAVHVLLVIAAIATLHWHVYLMDSASCHDFIIWIYVAIAFWAFDRAVRLLRLVLFSFDVRLKTKQRWSVGKVERFDNINVLRITVDLPAPSSALHTSVAYAGSHFYLYMPQIQALTSHPFSLVQHRITQDEQGQCKDQLVFCASIHKGITRVLNAKWQNKTLPIFLDGPYGVRHNILSFDDVFLFAAGIGITHILSLLDGVVEPNPTRSKNVHLVWCIRSIEMMAVAIEVLEDVKARLKVGEALQHVSISVFVTGQGTIPLPVLDNEKRSSPLDEKAVTPSGDMTITYAGTTLTSNDAIMAKSNNTCIHEGKEGLNSENDLFARLQRIAGSHPSSQFELTINQRRADIQQIISEQVTGQSAVFACGSDVFLDQIRNASLQVDASYFEEPFSW